MKLRAEVDSPRYNDDVYLSVFNDKGECVMSVTMNDRYTRDQRQQYAHDIAERINRAP